MIKDILKEMKQFVSWLFCGIIDFIKAFKEHKQDCICLLILLLIFISMIVFIPRITLCIIVYGYLYQFYKSDYEED